MRARALGDFVAARVMNDTELRPGEKDIALGLAANGTVELRTDCSTADGRRSSPASGQMRLYGLSLRQDGCAPGWPGVRTYDRLPSVRSYVTDGGRPYMATMADGSILELEPVPAPERTGGNASASQ